jgi:hypothetical protein
MLKATSSIVNVSQITGVLPVVNGGTGVTTSTGTGNTVLSAAPTLSGNVTLSTGNLIVASGQGIDFSATPGTGTSELLNDYEEGTWTPNQGSGLTVVGAFSSSGIYTKIGRQVTVTGRVTGATSVAVSSGGVISTNLPFTPSGTYVGSTINGTGTVTSGMYVASANVNAAEAMVATSDIYFTVTYFV